MGLHDLSIDIAARRVLRDNKAIPLTAREWVLFEVVVQNPTRQLSGEMAEVRDVQGRILLSSHRADPDLFLIFTQNAFH